MLSFGLKIKKKDSKSFSPLRSQRGIVTIPFLLVLMIILFLTISYLGLTMTLVHVSVSQYMSYATARQLALGGLGDIDAQSQKAIDYYESLRSKFFSDNAFLIVSEGEGKTCDGWFGIDLALNKKHTGNIEGFDLTEDKTQRNLFYGAGLSFIACSLEFQIPFLIKEKKNLDSSIRIISFLGREPTKGECVSFHKNRLKAFKSKYSSSYFNPNSVDSNPGGDNGC